MRRDGKTPHAGMIRIGCEGIISAAPGAAPLFLG